MNAEIRVTEWCETKEEIMFAVKQILKHDDYAEIKEQDNDGVISYAVFRR